ncbi:MAG: nicotinate (nicotinamide) nucleotide adenylyltransferase [Sulfurospirillaceae bacterium]|nr:nicotinate (nicotinamide) nucleotide adenylyltransferase [Sulfurospirillaceae bacterium]MDD2827561.1 nicotinate (nicotinamide) nucleotide adenylyltransferase [Sulfurospirillaceae bacterium]
MKIAIFGGSFDPPHLGHQKIVHKALELLDIDKLLVVPTYLNPFKESSRAPSDLRKKWLEQLFGNCKKITILPFESDLKRQVPTIETILHVKHTYPHTKLYLIVGSDSYATLPQWTRYEELITHVEIVVASRNGFEYPKDLKILPINVNISSSKLRENLDEIFIPKRIRQEVKEYYSKESNG